jgi:hypothetical protein
MTSSTALPQDPTLRTLTAPRDARSEGRHVILGARHTS